MVYVLPVPALASSTVTPLGSAPHTSNSTGWSVICDVIASSAPRAPAGRPTTAGLVAGRGQCQDVAEPQDPAECHLVLGIAVLAVEVPAALPLPRGRDGGILSAARRGRVRLGGEAEQRQRLPQPPGVEGRGGVPT